MTITPMDRRGDQNLINPVSIHIYYFEAIPSLVNIFPQKESFLKCLGVDVGNFGRGN